MDIFIKLCLAFNEILFCSVATRNRGWGLKKTKSDEKMKKRYCDE